MSKLTIRTEDEPALRISESDPAMKKLITVIGDLEILLRADYLTSIVRSIIGQQISVSAASAIYARMMDLLGGNITAEALLAVPKEELRQAGLTERKADYVKDLANKIASNELDLENIADYDDEEVMEQLIKVKGIGKWTAEMFLIMSLGRSDVLAIDDVGIQRAAKWLYGVETSERRQILIEKSPIWKPYRSVVSFYLWEAIHLGFLADYESVDELVGEQD
ncbi:DNA-3-methyladenine glycosylase family protein [Sporosarcina cascadiensis]|uniref:DNA-3-methyladenine glycosylase family protein n=1 Tax=Sporosarcina cascadiensis TaxID=2660747 RepID=UPI0018918335|nr:DNA-3-methyladenine glycosylase [Sporosarcina cascadiensis]